MTAELLTGRPAPEFSGLRGWLNSPTLTMTGLKGKVVLLDFWTYSCVNCIRTLPHMKLLHQKYSGQGLVLVGVHTPEFEFEKLPENVASAMKRFGIEYPVAIDSDNVTWKLYGNQYWPRQTLIDSTGMVRWEHAGEGDYDKMEEQIMRLLGETRKVSIPNSLGKPKASWKERLGLQNTQVGRISPEIYVGALRSQGFGNGQVCVPGSCVRFIDDGEHSPDVPYLNGDWMQTPEYVEHATSDPAYVLLKYTGRNANSVLGAAKENPLRVDVELDGHGLEEGKAGADVQWDGNGSYLQVRENRLYDIVRTKNTETHELKLVTNNEGLRLYTYTFG